MSHPQRRETAAGPNWSLLGRAALGFSDILLHSCKEVTELAGEMHSVIARGPRVFAADFTPDVRLAPLPYRVVAGCFSAAAALTAAVPRGEAAATESDRWRRFVAGLNGVLGDRLAARNNPLAIPLGVHEATGAPADLAALRERSPAGIVLFAHGLCDSDLGWHTPAHAAFVAGLQAAGFGAAWLRYNSGRAIHENGSDLADMLEAHCGAAAPARRLILVGHSMGGLVIRGACHAAERRRHSWLGRLTHAAYLGAPHMGTPLERGGNLANAVLALTPYSAPLTRLGNIRSRGIKDLRFGCVSAEESAAASDDALTDRRAALVALPPRVSHLLVAGSVKGRVRKKILGDGMVPVASALGQHHRAARRLNASRLQRTHIAPLGHLAMLGDVRVYDALRSWIDC